MNQELFIQVPQSLNQKGINHSTRSIFLFIAQHKNYNTNIAFPSYNTISKALGCSKSTISKAIKQLEELEYLKVARSKREGTNSNNVNQYLFLTNFKDAKIKIKTKKASNEEKKALEKFNKLFNKNNNQKITETSDQDIKKSEDVNSKVINNTEVNTESSDQNNILVTINQSDIKNTTVISDIKDINKNNYKDINVSDKNLTKEMRIKLLQLKCFGKSNL